jgi:hypothetical protein
MAAQGFPPANESDHLSPYIHKPEGGFGAVFVPGDMKANGRRLYTLQTISYPWYLAQTGH